MLKIGSSIVKTPPHKIGDTFFLDGDTEGKAEISYMYAHILKALDNDLGLKWLSGKTGQETFEKLKTCAKTLGNNPEADNIFIDPAVVGNILQTFADWAKSNPTAIWEVT